MPRWKKSQDGYGNEVFWDGDHVVFFSAATGNVSAFFATKGIPDKALEITKGRCQLIDLYKGEFKDQTKWKPMGEKVLFCGRHYSLTEVKIVNMKIRIGCVTLPNREYYMVYALKKEGDKWKRGEITHFQNEALKLLETIKGRLT